MRKGFWTTHDFCGLRNGFWVVRMHQPDGTQIPDGAPMHTDATLMPSGHLVFFVLHHKGELVTSETINLSDEFSGLFPHK